MHAEIFVRHTGKCSHRSDRYYRRCHCRKWIAVAGVNKRISAQTRSWEQAEKRARELCADPTATPAPSQTVRQAVKAYLEDKHQQSVSKHWERKLARELTDFAAWCDAKLILQLEELNLYALENYRKSWTGAPITRRKRQERLRSFFLYCIRHKWTPDNVAASLSTIKVKQSPTLPLDPMQFDLVMQTAERYNPKAPDSQWRRARAIAMLLLLRWSGLRISDAARLERSALTDRGMLRLYMAKTGEGVYVPLPANVVELLRGIPNDNPRYFFWNGASAIDSPGKRWWATLKCIFRTAGVPDAHPHMLRDTFAVEMLLAGVPLDQVSLLLGHSSTKITEKHYAPWIRARQAQLEESVRKAWAGDPLAVRLPLEISASIQ